MHLSMMDYLCDPRTRQALTLEAAEMDGDDVVTGTLVSPSGARYPIRNRVPRFVEQDAFDGVRSFGEQWNHFNFTDYKAHWLEHTVANTFGGVEAFRGATIVDAGGGSGAQSLWMLESGAKRVIMLELSHSVDDVVARNVGHGAWSNFDLVQCSIDEPPLRPECIDGMVICHNVIQHTPSVEKTAAALYGLVAPGGEFVFNCYRRGNMNVMNFIKTYVSYGPMRFLLSKAPFRVILAYSRAMGVLRTVPALGWLLNKLRLSLTGKVPRIEGESWFARKKRVYQLTALNTFDMFGSHAHQHYLSPAEQMDVVKRLQPDLSRVGNLEAYFQTPQPTGCALRVGK
ncbi:MAG: hypothetical protein JWN93_730 [Hyphomicrobiales bacterium]|nr:hypothetical protein [Hyphomicrobiales bacterium]